MVPKVVHLAVETLFRDSAIGSTGLINGRFLPSLKDVQNIAKSIRARNQMDSNDTRSAEALIGELETTLPGTMLFTNRKPKILREISHNPSVLYSPLHSSLVWLVLLVLILLL